MKSSEDIRNKLYGELIWNKRDVCERFGFTSLEHARAVFHVLQYEGYGWAGAPQGVTLPKNANEFYNEMVKA